MGFVSSVLVKLDRAKTLQKLRGAWNDKTLYELTSAIREDCNEFVRFDQGQLKESSYTASEPQKGIIVWREPYAKRVYYTGHPRTHRNAKASLRWAEVAKAKYHKEWHTLAQKLFREGCK